MLCFWVFFLHFLLLGFFFFAVCHQKPLAEVEARLRQEALVGLGRGEVLGKDGSSRYEALVFDRSGSTSVRPSASQQKRLIQEIKMVLRVLVLYIPLPMFWALFDQQVCANMEGAKVMLSRDVQCYRPPDIIG